MNLCCHAGLPPSLLFKWNRKVSRKSPHPYWPWLSVNKSWSIAHEAWLWQRSTHWAEFTEINISLPNMHLPSATIHNLCHSCSTSWQSWSHSELHFSMSKLHLSECLCVCVWDSLSSVSNLWTERWLWILIRGRIWCTMKPLSGCEESFRLPLWINRFFSGIFNICNWLNCCLQIN